MIQPLQKIPLFAGMEEDALSLLWQLGRESAVTTGQVVVHEGESGNRFFLINSGKVGVYKHHGQPDQVELAVLNTGDFFGEMCILETLPRVATVAAIEDTKLFSLSSLVFLKLYERMPAQYGLLALNMARDLSRRLRRLDNAFASRH